MLLSKPGGGAKCGLPCPGQVQRIVSPVAFVGPALQQTSPLELVDIADHPAGECSESPGKRALAQAWCPGQDFQNAGMRRNELQHGQPNG